jgi:hypothetical protein
MHSVSPVGQMHVLFMHVPPAGHALPQLPQFPMLVDVSTHVMLPIMSVQDVRPVAQPLWQTLLTHWLPRPHRIPQPPQSLGAEVVSTHWLLQLASPPPQAQAPATQLAPVPQTKLHIPQLEGSVFRFVHDPSQLVCPLPHVVTHEPSEQTWLAAPASTLHLMPQPPQLSGSDRTLVQTSSQSLPSL